MLVVLIVVACSGCAIYQAKTMDEWVAQAKQLDGSGCMYVRGNSRPYADVSVLIVSTYGKGAPKYIDCLQAIPPEARTLAP
jgi:hypothetical protein